MKRAEKRNRLGIERGYFILSFINGFIGKCAEKEGSETR